MASGRQECSICMNNVNNLKLISCHHSFCYKCLDDYVRVNLLNGRFDCPICRASVELPKSGVSGFQSNFYIDETGTSEKFYCDLCGPKHASCSRCLDCEENLCQSCCHAHEKSKVSRHHKICDLGTLDSKTKGKIRQRIFCDQHPDDEIRLFCRDCKVFICLMCKVFRHEIHVTNFVEDVAAEMKKTLQTKLNECSDKLRRLEASKQKGDEFDTCINNAEREELNTVEYQHSQLNKALDQEVAKVKAIIQAVYHDLRQQNAAFIRDVHDDFKTCSNAQNNAQTLVDHGTAIDIIKKGPDLEQLLSAVISKTDKTPNTRLESKHFSPAEIKPGALISLVGMMQNSKEIGPEEREKVEREEREKALQEEREMKEREEKETKEIEEKQRKEWSHRMEARVKAPEEELSNTRKQYEETKADAIAKGFKLTHSEKEKEILRIQHADYIAQVERNKREGEEKQRKEWSHRMEARVKAPEEELSNTRKQYEETKADAIAKGFKLTHSEKEKEILHIQHADYIAQVERNKREGEEKQRKEWSHRMEARVKAPEEELSNTRKQYEETKADAIAKGFKLTHSEKEIEILRIQHADYVAQEERERKEREERLKKEREER